MKNIKKLALVLSMIMAYSMSLAACDGNSKETTEETSVEEDTITDIVTETETETDTETESQDIVDNDNADIDTEAYIAELSDTCWVGMDSAYICYVLALGADGEIVFASNAIEEEDIDGYWGIAASSPTIYIYENVEDEEPVRALPVSYDIENNVLFLFDTVIMTQTDVYTIDDASDALEQMTLVAEIQEEWQNICWETQEDEENVLLLYFDGDTCTFEQDNGTESVVIATYYWAMDYENIYFYDEAYIPVLHYTWSLTSDMSALYLTNTEDDSVMTLTQMTVESWF